MLLNIREKTQGWVAYAIVLLICIPFALFGIGSYIGVGKPPLVAKVEGEEITKQALERRSQFLVRYYAQKYGGQFSFPDDIIRQQALDSLIERALLEKTVQNIGLRASDRLVKDYLKQSPRFQINGQFDKASYLQNIRQSGLSEAGFIATLRKDLVVKQFSNAHQETAFISDYDLQQKQRLNNQQRNFQFITIDNKPYLEKQSVTKEEIETFYKAHPEQYQTEQKLKIAYLDYSVENLKKQITIDEKEVKSYFEENKSEFVLPERRKVRHILIAVDKDASIIDELTAKTKAENLQKQLKNGADFSALAKENSDDAGSGEEGGDLGWVELGMMVKPFEESAFSLPLNTLSEPIRSEFGFHLIEVTEIDKPNVVFEKVAKKVTEAYKTKKATDLYYKLSDEIANLASEELDSLEVAATEAGIELQHSDWITKQGGKGLLSNRKILNKAFDEDFMNQNENSDPIEISDLQTVFIHIDEVQDSGIKPLAEVSSQIETHLKQEKAMAALKTQTEQWVEALKAGTITLKALAEEQNLSIEEAKGIKRTDKKQPSDIIMAVFKMPHPITDKTIVQALKRYNQDMSIIQLNQVVDGKIENKIKKKQRLADISEQGKSDFSLVLDNLKKNADIEVMK